MLVCRSILVVSKNPTRILLTRNIFNKLSSGPVQRSSNCCIRPFSLSSIPMPQCRLLNCLVTPVMHEQKQFAFNVHTRNSLVLPVSHQFASSLDDRLFNFRSNLSQKHRVAKSDIEFILDELPNQRSRHEELCSYLLQCCADFIPRSNMKERVELAQKIWTTFSHWGYSFNLEDVHAMLEVYASARLPFHDQLQRISTHSHLIDDQGSQLRLIQCAAEIGDLNTSAKVLGKMKQLGFPVGEEVFASLILGHGRARDYQSVQSILNTMTDAAVNYGPSTFVALLQAQIENDQPIRATLKQMEAQNIKLTEKQIVKLIYSIALSKRDNLVEKIFNINPIENMNPSIINCAIQLIHEGFSQLAQKLICTAPNAFGQSEKPTTFAAFYPQELVEANEKMEEILSHCTILQDKFPMHSSFLLLATEASLRDQTKTEMSTKLLGHVHPLRTHFFWPLIVRTKNVTAMASILNRMKTLGLRIDFDTLAFYVFPNLIQGEKPITLLQYLQKSCNLSVSMLLGPLLHALLSAKLLNEAVVLCKQYKTRTLDLTRLSKPLVSATLLSTNSASAINLLNMLAKSRHTTQKSVDIVGNFLIDYSVKCKPADIETMLKLIQEQKLFISLASFETLSSRPSMKQANLIEILNAITNKNQEGSSNFNLLPHPREMGVEELEGHLIELRAKNLNVRGILRKLLQYHCKLNNVKRAVEIKKELDDECYDLSPGILASMISLYIQNKDCTNAASVLSQLNIQHPSFKIDEHKILDYCTLKLQNGASENEINKILVQYEATSIQYNHSIKGGVNNAHNCKFLINTAKEFLGNEESKRISECLKALKFT